MYKQKKRAQTSALFHIDPLLYYFSGFKNG